MKLKINPESRTMYIPKEVIEGGFIGEVEILVDPATIVIARPGASFEELRISLDNQLRAITSKQIAEQSRKLNNTLQGGK
jgi:hypothetical protein